MKNTILLAALAAATLTARADAQAFMNYLGDFYPSSVSADGTTLLGTQGSDVVLYDIATGTPTVLSGLLPTSMGTHALSGDASLASGSELDINGFTNMARWDGANWVVLGGIGGFSMGEVSRGAAISDDGTTVVGDGWWNATFQHAVKWTAGSPMPTDLGALGGRNSFANAVSSDGAVVVGWDQDATSALERPALWSGGPQTYLGSLDSGNPTGEGQAWDVSGSGAIVVGESFNGTGTEPFKYENGTMTGLGILPGFVFGSATAISGDGSVIVGHHLNSVGNQEGVIWNSDGIQRLGDLLVAKGAVLNQGKPGFVTDLSFDGTVICGRTAGFPSFGFVALLSNPPTIYCTAKTNSLACVPQIGSAGTFPSLSDPAPFDLTASNVINNKAGLVFYGIFGAINVPALGGTLCVQPPLRRTPLQFSLGNPPPNDCTGTFAFDLNAWIQSGSDSVLVLGQDLNAQYWSRDPASSFGVSLTDALTTTVGP